jgi:hypothetical protein
VARRVLLRDLFSGVFHADFTAPPAHVFHRLAPNVLPVVLAAALALGGCASFSPDGGLGEIQQTAGARLGRSVSLADGTEAKERRAALLAQLLSADAAVQIALQNNRALRASLAELGIAEADYVQASRLPNPGFSVGRLARGGALEIDRSLQFDLLRLYCSGPMKSQAA